MHLPDFYPNPHIQDHHYGKSKHSGHRGDVGFTATPCFGDDLEFSPLKVAPTVLGFKYCLFGYICLQSL